MGWHREFMNIAGQSGAVDVHLADGVVTRAETGLPVTVGDILTIGGRGYTAARVVDIGGRGERVAVDLTAPPAVPEAVGPEAVGPESDAAPVPVRRRGKGAA